MPRRFLPVAALLLSHAALALTILYAAHRLPANVASHFNAQGIPDGWMPRAQYLGTMAAFNFGLSMAMLAVFYGIRYFPSATFNIPHREYWFGAQRRRETCESIFHAGLWLISSLAAFDIGLHLLAIAANNAQPVRLGWQIWLLVASLLIVTLVWAFILHRRFSRIPKGGAP